MPGEDICEGELLFKGKSKKCRFFPQGMLMICIRKCKIKRLVRKQWSLTVKSFLLSVKDVKTGIFSQLKAEKNFFYLEKVKKLFFTKRNSQNIYFFS